MLTILNILLMLAFVNIQRVWPLVNMAYGQTCTSLVGRRP